MASAGPSQPPSSWSRWCCRWPGLAFALRELPVGTAYAVWTGIGAVGTAIFGMVALGEPVTVARIVCLGLIVSGIVGLKVLH